MNARKIIPALLTVTFTGAACLFGADEKSPAASPAPKTTASAAASSSAQPSDAEMMAKMMAFAQPGENHQLIADLLGGVGATSKH